MTKSESTEGLIGNLTRHCPALSVLVSDPEGLQKRTPAERNEGAHNEKATYPRIS